MTPRRAQLVSRPLEQSAGQLLSDLGITKIDICIYDGKGWKQKGVRPHNIEVVLEKYDADELWPFGSASALGGPTPVEFEFDDSRFELRAIGRLSSGGFYVGVYTPYWSRHELRGDLPAEPGVTSSRGVSMTVGYFRELFQIPVAATVKVPNAVERLKTFLPA